MKTPLKLVLPVTVLAVLGLGISPLFARQGKQMATQHDKQIVKLMSEHKMTLERAVKEAEQNTKGEALNASAEMQGSNAVVNVTCVVGENEKTVTVDVNTGRVSEMMARMRTAPATRSPRKYEQPKKKP